MSRKKKEKEQMHLYTTDNIQRCTAFWPKKSSIAASNQQISNVQEN